MQRDTNGNERAPDVASRGDGENQSRYHEQIAVPFSRNENPNQALHEDMPDISHEAHDEAGSITEGPLEAPPHLRRMLHSTVQPLTEETEVKKVHDSVRDVSPSKTANRSAMLLQFEQDMLAKAQVTVPVSTAGKRAPFPVPFSSGNSASSAPASDDATENPSLTADYNSTSHLESLKSSDRDHRSGSIEHLCDDQESSEDGMDASATQSAPGDVENVTRAIITIRAAEDGTNASTVSAPGDVENVTRFGPSESLMKAPGLFEDSPPFILPYSDEERTDSSSMSSFGDVENAHRSIPLDSSDATLVSGHEDTQIHNVDDSSVAVAVPVSSEGDDERLSARRIFPDAKNPVWKGARLYFWLLVGCVVLVAIGSVTVAVTLTLKAQAGAPSAAPTTFAEGSDAYSSIVTLVGESALSLDSPAGQAAYWILYEDEMGLTESSESFIQRYLLSLFYFATTQKTSWRSCSRSARLDEQNCTFEKVVGIQLVGDVYTPVFGKSESARWLSPVHECAWGGVSCDPNDKVAGLELTGQGIDGTLPTEISLLPNLLTLYLSWNSFSGTLPSELIKLSTLILLELDSNHFTGSIPQQWTEFRQIQEINVGNNSLTGTWSTQFNDLKSLKGLFLHENQFKGTLPTEIGLLTDLGKCYPTRISCAPNSQFTLSTSCYSIFSVYAIVAQPVHRDSS